MWRDKAKCKGLDPAIFFPVPKNRGRNKDRKTKDDLEREVARKYCRGCPVKTECLTEALGTDYLWTEGVAGGKSYEQRLEIVRKRRQKAA